MILRVAQVGDIAQIQRVRNSVKENRLSNPNLVTDQDCVDYLTKRGKGWVYEQAGNILGFAIVDLLEYNIWALFVDPDYDKRGIGKILHDAMLDWYFQQTSHTAWLGTAPGTRAERFYRRAGWEEVGTQGKSEIKFEMTAANWQVQKRIG